MKHLRILFAILMVSCWIQNAESQPPSGLVSWWRGEGTANDATGANHGTLQNGVTFVPGKDGMAFHLDGGDDYVVLGSGNWFTLPAFTITMWVKASASQVGFADILDNNHNDFRSWVIQYYGGTEWHWGPVQGASDPGDDIVFQLTSDTWHHLAISFDPSFVNKVYVDGVLIGTTQSSGPIIYDGSQVLQLGSWGQGGRNFSGEIDELRIYDRALTDEEVTTIMGPPVPALGTGGVVLLIGFLLVAGAWMIWRTRSKVREGIA